MSVSVKQTILTTVEAEPGVTLAELLTQIRGSSPADIFQLLADGKLYIDLAAAFVGERDRVLVFKDETTAKFFGSLAATETKLTDKQPTIDLVPGATLLFDNRSWEVFDVGKTEITFYRKEREDFPSLKFSEVEKFIKNGKITNISITTHQLDRKSQAYNAAITNLRNKDEMAEALSRYETIVKPHLEGKPTINSGLSDRTHRDLIKAYKFAEAQYGNGLLGLAPKSHLKGNRSDRLELIDRRLRPLMDNFIATKVETPTCETKTAAYGAFIKLCKKKKLRAPSFNTFRKAIQKRSGPGQTNKMEGAKASYPQEEFLDEQIEGWDSEVPVHGDYPWEYAHIDHTLMDVVLRHTDKGVIMGRAWITLLIDSFSRRVIAYYITYDAPSYRSCMGIIRECVRGHGRLPECIIADGGKEFKSIYFQTLLAHYKVNIIWRPATKPRFGAVIERFIHTLNKQFLHNLRGNTKIMKNVRKVTKSVNPETLAVWNFPLLDESLERYLYHEYPNREHSSLGQTPMQAFKEGIEKFSRPDPPTIKYDDALLIDTMPSTKKGTAKLVRSRGFKIYGIYYRAKELQRAELYGKQVEVRYDCWDLAHAYAWVKNRWVLCYAPKAIYAKLKNRSEREIRCITEQARKSYRNYGRNFKVRALDIAEKLAGKKKAEAIETQRLKDQEMRTSAARRGRRLSPSDNPKRSKSHESAKLDKQAKKRRPDNVTAFDRAKRIARS